MELNLNPIYVVNLVLCIIIIILILGYLTHRKSKDTVPINVSIEFVLFGITHLATILGLKEMLSDALIVIRTIGVFDDDLCSL